MTRILTGIIICVLIFTIFHAESYAAEISILAVGDITIGNKLAFTIEQKGVDALFAGTAALLKSADVTLGTLESSISDRGEPRIVAEVAKTSGHSTTTSDPSATMKYTFRAPPDVARGLANAGFKVLSLATPHIMDYGDVALEDTITLLSQYNVKTVGAGSYVKAARQPVTLTVKNTAVTFLAYYYTSQYGTDFADNEHPGPMLAVHSIMQRDIAQAKKESDIVVVFIHWGILELGDTITERQRFFAHNIIDAGADIVLGQQLHALKGIEIYNGKAIVYSLADFIFEMYDKQHSKTVIPIFHFQDGNLKQIELIPIWVDNPDVKYQPQVLHKKDAQAALENFRERCMALNTTVDIQQEKGWIRL